MEEQKDLRDELRALAADAAEATSYLRELGVEVLEGFGASPADDSLRGVPAVARHPERPAPLPPALERNARAERVVSPLPKMPAASSPPEPPAALPPQKLPE